MKSIKFIKDRKGQSIVEISLITPLLLVALYVPADFGIAFFTAHLTQNAAREGARIAAISPECGTSTPCVITVTESSCPGANPIVQEVCSRLPARLAAPISIKTTLSGNLGDTCMRMVKVEVSGKYNFFLYQIIRLIGVTLTNNDTSITRAAELRYELQPVTYSDPCP
jgi:Flp pilus assembly protein TadG